MKRILLMNIVIRIICFLGSLNLAASYAPDTESKNSSVCSMSAHTLADVLLSQKRDFQTRGYFNRDLQSKLAQGKKRDLIDILRRISQEPYDKEAYGCFARDLFAWTKTEDFKNLPWLNRIALWTMIVHPDSSDKFIVKIGRHMLKKNNVDIATAISLLLRGHVHSPSNKKKGKNLAQQLMLFSALPWHKKRITTFTAFLGALSQEYRDRLIENSNTFYHTYLPQKERFYCDTNEQINLSVKGLVAGGWLFDIYALLAQLAQSLENASEYNNLIISDENWVAIRQLTDRIDCLVKDESTQTNALLLACAAQLNHIYSQMESDDSASDSDEDSFEAPESWWHKIISILFLKLF